jgi:hypothetical protein
MSKKSGRFSWGMVSPFFVENKPSLAKKKKKGDCFMIPFDRCKWHLAACAI